MYKSQRKITKQHAVVFKPQKVKQKHALKKIIEGKIGKKKLTYTHVIVHTKKKMYTFVNRSIKYTYKTKLSQS